MHCTPRALLRASVLIIAIVGISTSASPQETSTSNGPAPVYGLDLKEHEAIPAGKVAGATGTVHRVEHRFQLEHLDIMQPMVVAVIAENPSRPVDVSLAKYTFDNVQRESRTDSDGRVMFKFRTEGDLRILVRGATGEPTPYSLVVWVGEEMAGDARAPFVPMKKQLRLDGIPWRSARFAAGVFGGLVCAAFALFLLRPLRRRWTGVSRQAGVPLVIVGLCTSAAWAQTNTVAALSPVGLADAVMKAGVDKVVREALAIGKSVVEGNFDPLSAFDISQEPDYSPPGMPELPSNCLNSDECLKCFKPANDRLKLVITTLERLRRRGAWTKTYKDRAIAVGSAIASLPWAGVGWAGAKMEIDGSYVKFQGIYDAKYEELISSLKESLQDISACEESVYHENDWYNRFGFIYFQYMAERYRRTD